MIPVNKNRGKYNNAKNGKFIPLNPHKYNGNPNNIIFKSNLEYLCMKYLDKNENIIQWTYEPHAIKYYDPINKKIRRYYIDFTATVKQGILQKTIWLEVKMSSECKKPSSKAKPETHKTWIINNEKWKAASQIAKSKNIEFHILNETQLI